MRQTNENLSSNVATMAMMRWLVAAALDNSYLTYGEAKHRLEEEVGFDRLARAGRTGYTAGSMIDKLLQVDPLAPLLNVLLVERATELPSDGAGSFLANRYGEPRLRREGAKDRHPRLWRRVFDMAAGEVYATPEVEWRRLFQLAFGDQLDPEQVARERQRRKAGAEDDGIQYGRSGEGPNHKALRLWVHENPGLISKRFVTAVAETEFVLDSADRVDVLLRTGDGVVAVEVKSRDSNVVDLRRGVFQCIKYRAVLQAMDIREDDLVDAMLVTEQALPGEISTLLKKHQISHFLAPMDRN